MGANTTTAMKAAAKPARNQLEAKLNTASKEKQLAEDQLQAMLNRITYLQCEEAKMERDIQNARKKAEALLASKLQRVHAKSGSSDTAQAVVEVLGVLQENDCSIKKGPAEVRRITAASAPRQSQGKAASRVKGTVKQENDTIPGDQVQTQLEATEIQSCSSTCTHRVTSDVPATSVLGTLATKPRPNSSVKVLHGDLSCMGVRKAARQLSGSNRKQIHAASSSIRKGSCSCQATADHPSSDSIETDTSDTALYTSPAHEAVPADSEIIQLNILPERINHELIRDYQLGEQPANVSTYGPEAVQETEETELIPDEVLECSHTEHAQERTNKLEMLSASYQQHDTAAGRCQSVIQVTGGSNVMQQLQDPQQAVSASRIHEHAASLVSKVISLKSTAVATAPPRVALAGGVGWGLRASTANQPLAGASIPEGLTGGCTTQSTACSVNNGTLANRLNVSRDGSSASDLNKQICNTDCGSDITEGMSQIETRSQLSQCSSRGSRPSSCSASRTSSSGVKSVASSSQTRVGRSAPVSRASSIKTRNLPRRPSSSKPSTNNTADQEQGNEPDISLKQQIWKLRRAFGLESAVLKDTTACVEVCGAGAWQ